MKKIAFVIALGVLGILGITMVLKWNRLDFIAEHQDGRVTLENSTTVSQKFTSRFNNLYRILIMSGDTKAYDWPYILKLSVIDESKNETVRTVEIQAQTLGTNNRLPITFAPIPDSAGKSYRLAIENTASTESASSPVSFGISSQQHPEIGYGLKNPSDPTRKANLSMRTYYRNTILHLKMDSLKDMAQKMSADPYFFAVYSTVLAVTVILILRKS